MKISRKILYILSTLLFVCCNTNKEFSEADFGDVITLERHTHDLNRDIKVKDIWGVNDSLVLINIEGGVDHNCLLARLSDFSIKSEIKGMKGDSHIIKNRGEIMFFDPIPSRISIVDYEGKLVGKMWSISGVDVARDISFENSVFAYVAFDFSFKKSIVKQKSGDKITLTDFSRVLKRIPDQNICSGFLGLNPTTERVVFAYQYLKRFEIYDNKGELMATLVDSSASKPSMSEGGVSKKHSTIHYGGVSTTAERIYLYYVGQSAEELKQQGEMETFIEEFDWDGNPICRYEIGEYFDHFDYLNGTFVGSTPMAEYHFATYKK